ncbi:MAG: UvrD-helicase domain-containing protein, partial [Phototrophicaceae bacterium]
QFLLMDNKASAFLENIQTHVHTLEESLSHAERGELNHAIEAFTRFSNLNKPRQPAKQNRELGEQLKQHLNQAKAYVETMLTQHAPLSPADEQEAKWLVLWEALIAEVQQVYRAVKQSRNVLDFNDLEHLTDQLLQNHPQVCARYVGREFKQFLVDEFQDTNYLQWRIIEKLTHQAQGDLPSLFIVGDPKQSIYGFRGGDLQVFQQVRTQIKASSYGAEIDLQDTFRLNAPLANTLNHLFPPIFDTVSPFGVAYDALRSSRPLPSTRLPLRLMLIAITDPTDPERKLKSEDARIAEGHAIAQQIHQSVHEGIPIHDKSQGGYRPIGYGDIALLFQATKSITLYEQALRDWGLPYMTIAGRGYYDRQEVWDLSALLQALYHYPADDLALAEVLRSPLFGLSDNALFALRMMQDADQRTVSLWHALANAQDLATLPTEDLPTVERAHDILNRLRQVVGRLTVTELLDRAIDETGYLMVLSGLPNGDLRRANVQKLLQKAYETNKVTYGAFTRYLMDMKTQEVREGNAFTEAQHSIVLMSIHASKGLEFPMVYLADASRKPHQTYPILIHDRQDGFACKGVDEQSWHYQRVNTRMKEREHEERKRLLYVAMTRARDYLVVSGQATWKDKHQAWSSEGWLDTILTTTKLDQVETSQVVPLVGDIAVDMVCVLPSQILTTPTTTSSVPSVLPAQMTESFATPPLCVPLPPPTVSLSRHLTATEIAMIGSASHDERDYRYFRQNVLYAMPSRIEQVAYGKLPQNGQQVPRRILGEIVHRALRWWRFPTRKNPMQEELTSYAWELGLTTPEDIQSAVDTARGWLRDFALSPLYKSVEQATTVYRELPFIYRTEKRVIHGVIDLLYQTPNGEWVIVDYKSATVQGYRNSINDAIDQDNQRLIDAHAKRYALQVGVYAATVEQYLRAQGKSTPAPLVVYIYYLRYSNITRIEHHEWATALGDLEGQIGQLLQDDRL